MPSTAGCGENHKRKYLEISMYLRMIKHLLKLWKSLGEKDEELSLFNLLLNVSVNSLYDITWYILNKLANYTGIDRLAWSMLLLQETELQSRGTMATGKVSRCETCEVQIVWRGVRKEKSWICIYGCGL